MRENSLLRHTARVTLELSNQCNLWWAHKRCPAHRVIQPITLPSDVVRAIMDYMAREDFGREIAYHNYSEPLVDPRLFSFIDYCRETGAAKQQYILTNGKALDQTMVDELIAHGITRLWASGYNEQERKRLKALTMPEKMNWKLLPIHELDHRLEQYDRPRQNIKCQCCEPLENLLIRATGDVALCCMDWAATVTFGNLKTESLESVLAKGKMQAIWKSNMQGHRHLDVCRRCITKRISKLYPPT